MSREDLSEQIVDAMESGNYKGMEIVDSKDEGARIKIKLGSYVSLFIGKSSGRVTLVASDLQEMFPYTYDDLAEIAQGSNRELINFYKDQIVQLKKCIVEESNKSLVRGVPVPDSRKEFVQRMKQYNKERKAARDEAKEIEAEKAKEEEPESQESPNLLQRMLGIK